MSERNNPPSVTIEMVETGPGLYTLPEPFVNHGLHLGPEFIEFADRFRASATLWGYIAYEVKHLLNNRKTRA